MAAGVAPVDAVRMATLGAARSLGVERDYGSVAAGRIASLALVEDLAGFRVRRVIARGRLAAEDGAYVLPRATEPYPAAWSQTIRLARPLTAEDFALPAGDATLRAIGVVPGSLLTDELELDVARDADGGLAPGQGLAKIAVADRHEASGRVGLGVIRGLDVAHGAFAATVNPGMANLMVVGVDDADMALAANRAAELGGGIVVVRDGAVCAEVALPLFGMLSHAPLAETSAACTAVGRALREQLGCPHEGILTTAGFVCLPSAIPRLKLSDHGLVRVSRGAPGELVPLACEAREVPA